MFDLLSIIFVSRWAGGKEDKYFARIGKNAISVYETDTMTLLDKKSLKVDNVKDFNWFPTDPILPLFVPEGGGGNQPAKVSIIFYHRHTKSHGFGFQFKFHDDKVEFEFKCTNAIGIIFSIRFMHIQISKYKYFIHINII